MFRLCQVEKTKDPSHCLPYYFVYAIKDYSYEERIPLLCSFKKRYVYYIKMLDGGMDGMFGDEFQNATAIRNNFLRNSGSPEAHREV